MWINGVIIAEHDQCTLLAARCHGKQEKGINIGVVRECVAGHPIGGLLQLCESIAGVE
jgi:hypothetical protein